jgi:hypothetical protein
VKALVESSLEHVLETDTVITTPSNLQSGQKAPFDLTNKIYVIRRTAPTTLYSLLGQAVNPT